ncbi:hypothetical protein [Halobacillus sp. A5]|uniref:hypothetical protein n=1 Tax=Halobacillus sp. A5 TaxID=2880263 RepID=UPI0020A6C5B2|nr:hypothetical protein [Halobacillus sp. A5]MCP3026138.1 hypothetical protein [Halobacillus sp. A5]
MRAAVKAIIQSLQGSNKDFSRSLRAGQVVKGEIKEILPGNKAVVKINHQTMKAQLDTPLTKGERYLMQVKHLDEQPLLKVLSVNPSSSNESLIHVLQSIEKKPTKTNISFLQQLLKRGSSFTNQSLYNALTIMEKEGISTKSKEALLQMFDKQLPVKESIFQALRERSSISMSKMFNDVAEKGAVNRTKLQDTANVFAGRKPAIPLSSAVNSQLIRELSRSERSSFLLLKQAQAIPSDVTFSKFTSRMEEAIGRKLTVPLTRSETDQLLQEVKRNNRQSLLIQTDSKFKEHMAALFKDQLAVSPKQLRTLSEWSNQLSTISSNGRPNISLLSHTHEILKNESVFTKVQAALGESFKTGIQKIEAYIKHPEGNHNLPLVFNDKVQSLVQRQVSAEAAPQFLDWTLRGNMLEGLNKDSILLKMKAVMQLTGFQDEAGLLKDSEHQFNVRENTVKSLLLHSLQESGSKNNEILKQALHLLNGIQIASQHETAQTLQLTMQFPAEFFQLNEDAYVHLESKKNNRGEIDPDTCRIMFYLNLQHMNETAVDLMIIQRSVNVTVYNENEGIDKIIKGQKNRLSKDLEQLNYQLASVVIKQGKDTDVPSDYKLDQRGVDLKI